MNLKTFKTKIEIIDKKSSDKIRTNYINKFGLIRQIGISLSKLDLEIYKDINLLSDLNKEEKEHNLLLTINKIKNKYGKNSLLKASNLLSFSTQKIRNELIGGHHE